jgi:hypothetical protein
MRPGPGGKTGGAGAAGEELSVLTARKERVFPFPSKTPAKGFSCVPIIVVTVTLFSRVKYLPEVLKPFSTAAVNMFHTPAAVIRYGSDGVPEPLSGIRTGEIRTSPPGMMSVQPVPPSVSVPAPQAKPARAQLDGTLQDRPRETISPAPA